MVLGIEQLAFTFDLVGKVLIGIAVLRVHGKLRHEMKIDRKVFKSIQREKWWTYLGLVFLVAGWFMHMWFI